MGDWTFITNHGAVLALVAEHGQITAREIATRLNITERSVHRIIADLEGTGYLERNREGRSNWYHVRHELPLRRDLGRGLAVGDLLRVLTANQFAWDWPPESPNT